MGKKKVIKAGASNNSTGNLEPINKGLFPAHTKTPAEVEEFLEEYPNLMGQALLLMLSQDEINLKLTINRLQSLAINAKAVSEDEIEKNVIDHMASVISIFEPLLRSMRFMNQGRFETASKEYSKLKDMCYASVKKLTNLYNNAMLDQQAVIKFLMLYFQVYGGWMKGYELQCKAEILGYQGNTKQYAAMLRNTVEQLRNTVGIIPAGSSNEIVQIGMMCSKIADELEVRAEVFENVSSKKRYMETSGNQIFIIHGHAEAKWRELRDLLEDEFKLPVVVLKEEAGKTQAIINKFEDYAMESCYAFAILTPDDFVTKDNNNYLQARPNVIFEMGWFHGRFGPGKLCIIKQKGTNIPSDLEGISTIEFKESIVEKSLAIRKELRQASLVQ